jgi:alcohol dehydrogenase class IV
MTGFFLAPRIGFGAGAIEQLSGLGARAALVLVDDAVAHLGGERRIVEELTKSETSVEVVPAGPEPDRLGATRALAERIDRTGADWVIAVGGGRTLDAAKAARLASELPGADLASLSPAHEGTGPAKRRLVAIPTTSGSGADVAWTADLVDEGGQPLEIAHRALPPDWSLVDPAQASGLPVDRVVDGAFESLALAAEAYLSAWSNPFSDALALAVVTEVVERLPHAVRWSDDPEARAALHYAATSAGLASSNAQRGVAHALARSLVGPTGLPYGRLAGIALPHVLEFDRPGARDRLETLAAAVRPPDDRAEVSFAERVRRLMDQVRLPTTVRAAGGRVEPAVAALDRIVAEARRSPGSLSNPRVPTDPELRALAAAVLGAPDAAPR